MKIENGKIVFESVQCWNCDGTGQDKYFKPCINDKRKTYNKKCSYCGGKGVYGHKYSDIPYYKPCHICNATGYKMEDKMSTINQECLDYIVDNMTYIFKGELNGTDMDNHFIKCCFVNVFAGCDDYNDHRLDTKENLLPIIKKSARDRHLQVLNYIAPNGEIVKEVVYYGYRGGYSADFVYQGKEALV